MRASRCGLLVWLNGGQIDADNLGLGVSVGWMSRVSGGWRGRSRERSRTEVDGPDSSPAPGVHGAVHMLERGVI
jgi:hypothetical protein